MFGNVLKWTNCSKCADSTETIILIEKNECNNKKQLATQVTDGHAKIMESIKRSTGTDNLIR